MGNSNGIVRMVFVSLLNVIVSICCGKNWVRFMLIMLSSMFIVLICMLKLSEVSNIMLIRILLSSGLFFF